MNTPEPAVKVKAAPKTVKEQLADRASPRCSKCGGRGHLGVNIDTDQYIPCRCVKRKLVKKPPTGELAAHWLEATKSRIAQNTAHLKRLHEEILQMRYKETSCITAIADANELTDEEQEIQLEAEFEQRRIDRMREMVATYTNKAAALYDEADSLSELAETAKKEAAQRRVLSGQRMREIAVMELAIYKEEKRQDNSEADCLARQRATKVHKLRKHRREIQARTDKLRIRAGKVQIAIDEDVAVVAKHEKGEVR